VHVTCALYLIYIFTLYIYFSTGAGRSTVLYLHRVVVMVVLLVTFLCRCMFILARFSTSVLGTCCSF